MTVDRFTGMSVDDFLGGGFMQGASDDEDEAQVSMTSTATKWTAFHARGKSGEEGMNDEDDDEGIGGCGG